MKPSDFRTSVKSANEEFDRLFPYAGEQPTMRSGNLFTRIDETGQPANVRALDGPDGRKSIVPYAPPSLDYDPSSMQRPSESASPLDAAASAAYALPDVPDLPPRDMEKLGAAMTQPLSPKCRVYERPPESGVPHSQWAQERFQGD